MGLIATGIFQARRDGCWVDVVSEVDPGDVSVAYWLDIFRPPRGLPADFEVVDGWHPIDRAELRPRWDDRPYVRGHPLLGHLCFDDHVQSWLHGDEILAGRRHAIAWRFNVDEDRLPDDVEAATIPYWYELGSFFDEVARLVSVHDEVRLVFGLTY